MLLNKIGLRINTDFQRVEKIWIERARKIQISIVGDVCFRLQGFHAGFNQYGKKKKFAGPALTVKVRPGDNLMLHKAIDIAQPGDVIVIDAGAALNTSIFGAMMSNYALKRGVEAMVVSGAIRDVEEISHLDLGVVALGATPNGPFKSGPGEIGYPVTCGGVTIHPGDLILGDWDGVQTVDLSEVPRVIEESEAVALKEQEWEKQIQNGTWDRKWVDESINKLV
jgi:RraA family protein